MGTRKKIERELSEQDRATLLRLHAELCEEWEMNGEPTAPARWRVIAGLVAEALHDRRERERQALFDAAKRADEARAADEKARAAATARAARDAVVKAAEAWYGPRLNDLASRVMKARASADQARREAAGGMALPVGCSGEEWQARRADAEARADVLQREAEALAGDLSRLRAQFEEACKPQE